MNWSQISEEIPLLLVIMSHKEWNGGEGGMVEKGRGFQTSVTYELLPDLCRDFFVIGYHVPQWLGQWRGQKGRKRQGVPGICNTMVFLELLPFGVSPSPTSGSYLMRALLLPCKRFSALFILESSTVLLLMDLCMPLYAFFLSSFTGMTLFYSVGIPVHIRMTE